MTVTNRKQPVRAVFPRRAARKEEPTAPDLSSCLSYALLILYILASASATKDSMLLVPSKGIQLPLVTVTVSVVGFYALSPLLVLIGHLITLRRLPKMYAGLKTANTCTPHGALDMSTDKLMLGCLLIAGPATLLYILSKFTAYQSAPLFIIQVACLYGAWRASRVRYQELLANHVDRYAQRALRWTRRLGASVLAVWLLICIDVIFIPAKYSAVLYLKSQTTLLNSQDGTVAWVPHIQIDRSEKLWAGPATTSAALATYSGVPDSENYFMAREVGMDLRSRHLRFLDISMQVIPRVWAHDADLSGANLNFARLYGSVFVNTSLDGANFRDAELDGSTFQFIDLDTTSFVKTSMKGSLWDTIKMTDVSFVFADLALASFYGVTFENVDFKMTSLQATSYFRTNGKRVSVMPMEPYQILDASESVGWPKQRESLLKIDPMAALQGIRHRLCKPKLEPSWEFAWNMFIQTRVLFTRTERELNSVVLDFLTVGDCKNLPDQGLREYTDAFNAEMKKQANQVESPAPPAGSVSVLPIPPGLMKPDANKMGGATKKPAEGLVPSVGPTEREPSGAE